MQFLCCGSLVVRYLTCIVRFPYLVDVRFLPRLRVEVVRVFLNLVRFNSLHVNVQQFLFPVIKEFLIQINKLLAPYEDWWLPGISNKLGLPLGSHYGLLIGRLGFFCSKTTLQPALFLLFIGINGFDGDFLLYNDGRFI